MPVGGVMDIPESDRAGGRKESGTLQEEPPVNPVETLRRASARAASQRASDLEAGRARIGGSPWSRPDYLRSYLDASGILVREATKQGSLNSLAVACAYTQRHTLELAIKALIDMLHTIADLDDEIGRGTLPSTAPSSDERRRATRHHILSDLLNDLCAARQREMNGGATYSEFPPDLAALVAEMSEIEELAPERLRYPTVRIRDRGLVRSFDAEVTIPIGNWQSRLEALIDSLFESGEFLKGEDSFGWSLANVINHQLTTLHCGR